MSHGLRSALFLLLCALALLGGPPPANAQATPAAPAVTDAREPIRVATRVIPPFVLRESGQLTGFSMDLLFALAREMNQRVTIVETDTVPNLLGAVEQGRADMAIAAISITAERERRFDFSQPMFEAGLQIMVPAERAIGGQGLSTILQLVTSQGFLEVLGVFALLMLIPVPIIWWLERPYRDEELLRANSRAGEVGNALWWTTSALIGQATTMPRSVPGRMLAIVWMMSGVVFLSFFTASVTTALTVRQLEAGISSPDDLAGKTVATVTGSTAAAFLETTSARRVDFPRIADAYAALEAGRADAIVFDAPVLQYHAAREGRGKVRLAGGIFRPENYGVLFPQGSPLRKTVNEALLRLRESGEFRAIQRRWFSPPTAD